MHPARMGLQSRVVCSRRSSNLLDCQTNHLCATMVNCATEVSSSDVCFFFLCLCFREDIKHRINNLSHSSE